ncbi:uroporphyrinogen-III C-methyltransferase [SAR92 clade bacterium H455]|uniref:Uroporphyrinogen-III C-methyltransferase n=1 Tax=SAR92 clade bacterium H455 TaxID=2974818 RepID=A0ABY5TPM1_9GAMM|nr:uroporphyrinogen-III C-methyltransferase [SAR92 clade bacterium H455]
MVTEKKPAAPAASDKKESAKAGSSVADKPPAKNKASQAPVNKSPKNPFPWFKTILLLLLIAALAGSSWFGWMQWQQRSVLAEGLQSNLIAFENNVERQQQAVIRASQEQSQTIKALQDQLYSLRLLTNRQAEQILTLGTATRGDWLLAEATYLVRLANQRLQVERSIENPLAILESVDSIFIQINDPELLAVRNALAIDIAALRMTEIVDREGIYLELQAISSALETLSILQPRADDEAAQQAQAVQNSQQAPSSLTETLERFSEKFGNLIVLQKRQQPIEPLLSRAERTMVRQNFYLLLEQAQSALLREEQIIYSSSLNKAEALLRRYFQLNSESEALIARLQALAERSVSQQLPDISGSQNAIQTALNLRHGSTADEGAEQ